MADYLAVVLLAKVTRYILLINELAHKAKLCFHGEDKLLSLSLSSLFSLKYVLARGNRIALEEIVRLKF